MPDEAGSPAPEFEWQAQPYASPELPPALGARFEVLGSLGRGGMGQVLRARDRASGREVAVKLVTHPSEASRKRMLGREGQLTASLRHPGIVAIHDAGEVDGVSYLIYALVPGARPLLSEPDGRAAFLERLCLAAEAIGYAHGQGVIHRDLKPENILVDASGQPRVTDFGLAWTDEADRLTKTGVTLGTPLYMAPECFGRAQHDVRVDVWALGVILYEGLTGSVPYGGGTLMEHIALVTSGRLPVGPRELDPSITPEVEAVCLEALSLDPDQRYANGAEFAAALSAALQGETSRDNALWKPLLGLAAALLVGAIAFALAGGSTPPAPEPAPAAPNGSEPDGSPPVGSTEAGEIAWRAALAHRDRKRRLQATWSWLQEYGSDHPRSGEARREFDREAPLRPLFEVSHGEITEFPLRVVSRERSLLTYGPHGARAWQLPGGEPMGAWFRSSFVGGLGLLPDAELVVCRNGFVARHAALGEPARWQSTALGNGRRIEVSPDGRLVACGLDLEDQPVQLLSAVDGSLVGVLRTEEGYPGRADLLRFVDGQTLLVLRQEQENVVGVGAARSRIRRWLLEPAALTATIELRNAKDLAVSPDRSRVLISTAYGLASLRDSESLAELRRLRDTTVSATGFLGGEVYDGSASCVAWVSDQHALMGPGVRVPDNDRVLKLFGLKTGEVRRVSAPLSGVTSYLSVSPDGSLVAVGLRSGRAQVWALRAPN